jgi:hypothetical protein
LPGSSAPQTPEQAESWIAGHAPRRPLELN